jgi:hypothetical protein
MQRAFPLDVPIVPSSMLIVTASSERLSCDDFSHGETIRFGSLEFIVDCFSGLSLSPRRDGSDATIMGSSRSGPSSLLQAMIGHSTEELHTTFDREGGGGSNSPLPGGMARGLCPPPPQPYHGWRTFRPLRLWR